MKFGSKKAIFGVIWGGFEGFGPCLGVSHPTHPHLGEISQKKNGFFFGSPPKILHSAVLERGENSMRQSGCWMWMMMRTMMGNGG